MSDIYNLYAYQNSISSSSRTLIQNINVGNIIFNNNIINNINVSTINNSIVNKEYIDNYYKTPHLPNYSIQYNDGGSENLKVSVDSDLKQILINGNMISGSSYLMNGQINLLDEPILNDDAATKKYVDNINKKYYNVLTNDTSIYYNTSQFINSVNIRNGLLIGTTMDYLPSTNDIISQNIKTFTFNIFNNTTNNLAILLLQPSDSNTIINPNNIYIYGGYQLSAIGIVNDNNTVNIIITNNSFIPLRYFTSPGLNDNNIALNITSNPIATNLQISDKLLYPINPLYLDFNQSVTYSYSNILSKLIFRGKNLTSDITDYFDLSDSITNPSLTSQQVGFEFCICNISNFNITLNFNNSNIAIIPSNNNCLLLFTILKNNYSLLKLGIFSRY